MRNKAERLICRLKQMRQARGLSQGRIAEVVGVKRQAIYDIESGRYLPNTEVALRLARHLACRVEDLFSEEAPSGDRPVTMVEGAAPASPRITVARVRDRLVGYPLEGASSFGQGFRPADGLLEGDGGTVKLFEDPHRLDRAAMLLGCDPAFGILGSHVSRQSADVRLSCRFASSEKALKHLAAGHAHLAATHMHNTGSEQSNVTFAKKLLGEASARVIAFTTFEEGLMVARGNPHKIRGVSDLAKKSVRMVNREPGAALRTLLDDRLALSGIPARRISGYRTLVSNHEEGAQMVLHGLADAALGLRAVASAFGIDFVTLETVRCDIVIPDDMMAHQAVRVMLDVLQTRALRDELASLPGYDTRDTGKVIGTLS
jgi:putative molybdopterin biosynthesis protein